MNRALAFLRNFRLYFFEIMAIFAVVYVLALLTLVLVDLDVKLSITDGVMFHLKFLRWGVP